MKRIILMGLALITFSSCANFRESTEKALASAQTTTRIARDMGRELWELVCKRKKQECNHPSVCPEVDKCLAQKEKYIAASKLFEGALGAAAYAAKSLPDEASPVP